MAGCGKIGLNAVLVLIIVLLHLVLLLARNDGITFSSHVSTKYVFKPKVNNLYFSNSLNWKSLNIQ